LTEWNIEEAKARLEAATPGPWEYDCDGDTGDVLVRFGNSSPCYVKELFFGNLEYSEREDHTTAEFIANAPTDVANLLALVERLGAVNQEQAETIKKLEGGNK
jgi:hypothetical protein